MKIIDKLKDRPANEGPWYSFEVFPPKTSTGVENLFTRLDRMSKLEPLFIDVTWGAGGSTRELSESISAKAQAQLGVEVMMHLTCTNLSRDEIKGILNKAKEAGIQNILAIRGEPVQGNARWEATPGGLQRAIDLCRLIKEEHGDYFGIAVAGHPEGHPDSTSREEELKHLKEKVDAGADFILTQFFYNTSKFLDYVKECRAIGIQCPIIPGVMPMQSYSSFHKMTKFCKISVPDSVAEALEPIKHDDEAVKDFGVQFAQEQCRELAEAGSLSIHFYTLNLERSVRLILSETGYSKGAYARRLYPWRASAHSKRADEDVRPINWANRPKSYLARTDVWDEYPNGRWGDGRSPAFGDLSGSHFYSSAAASKEERRAMWGEAPIREEEIYQVFVDYVEGKIPKLPWCEDGLALESQSMQPYIIAMNRSGLLTINSQPPVNGAPSHDEAYGWGGPGGWVYQKSYVEFFASPDKLKQVADLCASRDGLECCAVKSTGNLLEGSISSTTALTWGVFPQKEVQQPTVFDPETYLTTWRDEAFQLWTTLWASLYDEESRSSELLHEIHDTWYLVAIIDNDYHSSTSLPEILSSAFALPVPVTHAATNGV